MRQPDESATIGSDRIGDLTLDRYRLGELSSEQKEALEQRLARDPNLAARLEQLRQESNDFAGDPGIRALAAVVLERGERQRHGYGFGLLLQAPFLAILVAAALLIVFWIAGGVGGPPSSDPGRGNRIKGDPLTFYVQVKRGVRQWRYDPATGDLQAGDRLRFVFNTRRAGWLYVLTIDANNQLSMFSPAGGDAPGQVQSGDGQVVAGAFELDESSGHEVALMLVCRDQVELGKLRRAAGRWEAARRRDPTKVHSVMPADADCQQAHVVLRKRPPAQPD